MDRVSDSVNNKSNNPYFSIILPIYNVERYLEECIQSVLEQDFQDYELILVDDGATDASPGICDGYVARYSHIRVIHKENGGLSSARNAGTEIAQGKYIWWVDSDDWVEPGALRTLYDAVCTEEPDMVKFHFYRVGQQRKAICCDAQPGVYQGNTALEQLRDRAFFCPGKFSLSAWGHIYKRTFLKEKAGAFVSERVIGSEDYLFNLGALAVAQKICVIPDYLYSYRLRQGSLTQRYRRELPEKYTLLYEKLRQMYADMGLLEDHEGKICRFYIWHLLHGTCFANEYRVTAEHSWEEGRKNVRRFLGASQCQYALRHCDTRGFSRKQKLQLWAMRWKIEPVFYWLFVRKPQSRKG